MFVVFKDFTDFLADFKDFPKEFTDFLKEFLDFFRISKMFVRNVFILLMIS